MIGMMNLWKTLWLSVNLKYKTEPAMPRSLRSSSQPLEASPLKHITRVYPLDLLYNQSLYVSKLRLL